MVHSTTGSEVDTRQRDKQKCLLCSNNHRLYRCDSFKSLEPADRNAFVIKHRLCVICLNENHGENKCRFNIQCKACGKRSIHNPLLHDALVVEGKSNESIKATSHSVSSFEKSIVYHKSGDTSYIIPVYLSRKDNPGNEVLTYALLDAQSDITFVTDNVAQSVTQPLGSKKWIDLSTMSSTNELVLCNRYNDLIVRGYSCDERLTLRKSAYGCDNIPHNLQVPCSDDVAKWPHLAGVAHKFPPVFECGIGLLIGRNCHYATFPAESVGSPSPSDPYAVRTPLGWTMVGPVESSQANTEVSHRVVFQAEVPTDLRMKDINSGVSAPFVCHVTTRYSPSNARAVPMDVVKQLESGFDMIGDSNHTESSLDDMEFIKILENGIEQENDGFYSMPLPFRGGRPPDFPNNRAQAVSRLKSLDRKLTDPNLFEKYDQFMRNMITSGDAEPIPANELNSSNVWYLPHHRVVNPKKPTKVRVVFDASCSFRGFSLNKSLLPGPDLNNSLVGVLTRFRERNVAVSCDIEKMFYRFRVNKDHRDFLRFLWYDDERNITEFRMSKHIFGAASSPGCAKYGLLRLAKDHSGDSPLAQWFIERCFYVDDGLFSCDTVDEATKLLTDTARICQLGNLKLHKMMSNEVSVLKSFPPSDLACDLSLLKGGVSVSERTLGIEWSPATDCFTFSAPIAHPDTVTRRNMLHLVASLFDPLGFIAPVVLTGKLILQRACHGMDWDEPVSEELAKLWDSWLIVLGSLNELFIPRCLKATVLGLVSQRVELHTYSDACEKGYGSCCYLRLLGTDGTVVTSLLFGKSRVVPLKGSTMPRLELQAAVLGAKIGTQLASELSVDLDSCYYWCDSTIALAYIQNSRKKLKSYVRNRVTLIRELTSYTDWHYISTTDNPADIASRGSSVDHLKDSIWFSGPPSLTSSVDMTSIDRQCFELMDDDPEVQPEPCSTLYTTSEMSNIWLDSVSSVSSWTAAVKIVSMLLHIRDNRWKSKWNPSVDDFQKAERFMIQQLQSVHFKTELSHLTNSNSDSNLPSSSPLLRLDPFVDVDGLLRVGGRTKHSNLLEAECHPVIMPKKTHLSTLLVRHYHNLCAHQGRGITMAYIRSAGFWVLNLNSAVSSHIYHCVTCRTLRRKTEDQKMADLPPERVDPSPPFTHVGVDYFGPYEVRDGRRYIKKWGVIFTCLYSRAVHVEVADDLTTDGFINCLRAFMALRGAVRSIHCDRGTNLVGAFNEFRKANQTIDDPKLKEFLSLSNCDFEFNSPGSSHMGGVWERQIRSFRNALNGLLTQFHNLDTSSVRTVFYEAMNIVNSRPLSVIDPDGLTPLTPNNLIQMKTAVVLPPCPGRFDVDDQYCRKRWRRVQAVIDMFWQRWKPLYLSSLQERQRWQKTTGFRVGDVVLLKEDGICRGDWKMCRIDHLIVSKDGLVRRVKLAIGDRSPGLSHKLSHLERPVHKLVLLVPRSD